MSNLGPLTTTFRPPASCQASMQTTWWLADTSTATGYYLNVGPTGTSDGCFPGGYDPAPGNIFSPGLYCPQGYSPTCQSLIPPTSTEGVEQWTVATCCPPGYTCNAQSTWVGSTKVCEKAFSDFSSGSIMVPELTFSPLILTTDTAGSTITTTVQTTVTNPAPGAFNAYGIVMQWKAEDMSSTATTSGSLTTATSSTSSNPTASSQEALSSGSGGLSTGAATGIGVGVALGVLAIVGIAVAAFYIGRRRRRRAATEPGQGLGESDQPAPQYHDNKPAGAEGMDGSHNSGYADAGVEMPESVSERAELPAAVTGPAELPSTHTTELGER